MFKKRNINKSTRREKSIEETNSVDNDDDSRISYVIYFNLPINWLSFSDTIEEKHLIRKLKRQAAGIDSEKLVQTTSNSKKPKLDNSQSKEAHGWSASSGGIVDNTEKLKEACVYIINLLTNSNSLTVQIHKISSSKLATLLVNQPQSTLISICW